LVDGCDDLPTEEQFQLLQANYLVPFFSAGERCFRMIVARRRPLTEYHLKIRSTPLLVGVFEDSQNAVEDQKNKLYSNFFEGAEPPANLTTLLPRFCTYQWNHPYINSFLIGYFATSTHLDSRVLVNCCLSVINRQHTQPEIRLPELDELIRLTAMLPEKWTETEFRTIIGREIDDVHILSSVIISVESSDGYSSPRYTVADGLRELLRDLSVMRERERTQ